MVKFRTRKHYGKSKWVGQLFAIYASEKAYRVFVFWSKPEWPQKFPVEFQILGSGKAKVWPKRKKNN